MIGEQLPFKRKQTNRHVILGRKSCSSTVWFGYFTEVAKPFVSVQVYDDCLRFPKRDTRLPQMRTRGKGTEWQRGIARQESYTADTYSVKGAGCSSGIKHGGNAIARQRGMARCPLSVKLGQKRTWEAGPFYGRRLPGPEHAI